MRYRITEESGGSGGTMYNFEPIQKIGRCWVVLKSAQQSENGTPSFLVAWAILQKTAIAAQQDSDAADNAKAICRDQPSD